MGTEPGLDGVNGVNGVRLDRRDGLEEDNRRSGISGE
jgi:hypothetical protein